MIPRAVILSEHLPCHSERTFGTKGVEESLSGFCSDRARSFGALRLLRMTQTEALPKRKNPFPQSRNGQDIYVLKKSHTISFNKVNEELDFFFLGQTIITENKNFGLNFIECFLTEVTDMH